MTRLIPPRQFRCDIRSGGPGIAAVAPVGELDGVTVGELSRALREVRSHRLSVLIVDLRELDFMDSSGLYVLLDADEWARGAGVELVIVQGSRAVQRVFELTRLDRTLPLIESDKYVTLASHGVQA